MPKSKTGKKQSGEHENYVLFRKTLKSGIFWYARFWDFNRETWGFERSTGIKVEGVRENRTAADKKAIEILETATASTDITKQNFIDYCISCWEPGSEYAEQYETDTGVALSSYYMESNRRGIELWVRRLKGFKRLNAEVDKVKAGDITAWKTAARKAGCGPRRLPAIEQAMRVPIRWAIDRDELKVDPFAKKRVRKDRGKKKPRS